MIGPANNATDLRTGAEPFRCDTSASGTNKAEKSGARLKEKQQAASAESLLIQPDEILKQSHYYVDLYRSRLPK